MPKVPPDPFVRTQPAAPAAAQDKAGTQDGEAKASGDTPAADAPKR